MFQPHPLTRARRWALVALSIALALEALRQIALGGFSTWPSNMVASPLYLSAFFLLTFASLWNLNFEATSLSPTAADIAESIAFVALTEERRKIDILGTEIDLRQLLLSEERLRDSEEEYRLLVTTIPEVVWKTDAKGNVIFVSPQVEALLGYSADEFRQQGDSLWFKSVHPDDKEKVGQAFEALIDEGKPYDIECRARKKNGEWFWAHDRAVATSDSNGSRVVTGLISDITVRKTGEESENRYRLLFENMLEGFAHCEMLFDDRGRPIDFVYLAVNSAFGKLTGQTNVVGKKFSEIVPGSEDSQRDLVEICSRVALTSRPERFEIEIRGLGMWFSISAYGAGNSCFVATFDNITERKRLEQSLREAEEKYRAIFEDAVVGIFQSTPGGRYINVNPAMARMLGYDSPHELISSITDISEQIYVDHKRREELTRLLIDEGMVKNFECEVYRKDGSKMWFSANMRTVSEDGVVVGYEGTNADITDRKVAEERIQYLAYYDALTGLPNRTLLQDRLTKALADGRRQRYEIALLFLDLDRFKDINDSLGHSAGDLLLKEVAERLETWGREQDTVARLGGDEFMIALTHLKDTADAAVAAERLMDAMTAEFVVRGHSIHVGCSIGISIFPEHGTDCETLIKNADAAMYSAKANGRNNFRFYTEDMNEQAVERLTLESSLRSALAKQQLFLMYQPEMDIATGRITGLEALLRWQHPELGLVPPDKFIRIAENSGLILPIGEWVLRTACSQARRWQDEGLPVVSVAVNVSAIQFRQNDFCELVRRVLHETGLAPQYLELELTESLLLADADATLSVLQELKAMGLTLAIDDFGTGYSSFNYLRQFHVSKLKIDRTFIRDVTVNSDDAAITTAIISMGKSLNIKVIAEGVETEKQVAFLRAHQCDEIQGYYCSKPLAVDKVADKLRGDTPEPRLRAQTGGAQS
jgi:diguanylate cyclase (GGDEF)-like protein/PAS domain S-box-containing protein